MEYKFKVYSAFSNSVEEIEPDAVGYVLDGADGYKLLQWTGCVDKYNIDIYEYDRIKYECEFGFGKRSIRQGHIEFAQGSFYIVFSEKDGDKLLLSECYADELEICGNKSIQ